MCVALWNLKIVNRDMINAWVLAVDGFQMCWILTYESDMKNIVGTWFCLSFC